MKYSNFKLLAAATLLAMASLSAMAQTSGRIFGIGSQVEEEQEQQRDARQLDVQPHRLYPDEIPEDSKLVVPVSEIVFSGNKSIPSEQLAGILSSALGKPKSLGQLRYLAQKVADHYLQQGLVARAYLPKQAFEGGRVQIRVLEASHGKLIVDTQGLSRLDPSLPREYLERARNEDGSFDLIRAQRAIRLLEDLPGVTATGILRDSDKLDVYDVTVSAKDTPLISGRVSGDNGGYRLVGRNQLAAELSINSPLRIGDQAGIRAAHSIGLDFVRGHFNFPVGVSGLRAGAYAAQLSFDENKTVNGNAATSGGTRSYGIDAGYPLLIRPYAFLHIGGELRRSDFFEEQNGAKISDYSTRVVSAGISGWMRNYVDRGGRSYASIVATRGHADLSGSPNEARLASTTRIAGNFSKLRLFLEHRQGLGSDASVYASIHGQRTHKNLDGSERFFLGGMNGVRAYPAGEAGGDEGAIAKLEVQKGIAQGLSIVGFYDHGRITTNKDNAFNTSADHNIYSLRGAGMALDWSHGDYRVVLTWARRIGRNPLADSNGRDQDGSHDLNRIWLNASANF